MHRSTCSSAAYLAKKALQQNVKIEFPQFRTCNMYSSLSSHCMGLCCSERAAQRDLASLQLLSLCALQLSFPKETCSRNCLWTVGSCSVNRRKRYHCLRQGIVIFHQSVNSLTSHPSTFSNLVHPYATFWLRLISLGVRAPQDRLAVC